MPQADLTTYLATAFWLFIIFFSFNMMVSSYHFRILNRIKLKYKFKAFFLARFVKKK